MRNEIVYALEHLQPHECIDVLGVYSTYELAEMALERYASSDVFRKKYLTIEEYERDKDLM